MPDESKATYWKPAAWRDVDSAFRRFGVVVRAAGAEVYFGRRLYRVRWGKP
jgi:hypothetical protein